ncbi:hypothetical protein [Niallia circulans]
MYLVSFFAFNYNTLITTKSIYIMIGMERDNLTKEQTLQQVKTIQKQLNNE